MCNSAWFERLILFFIVMNTIVLTIKWYDMPPEVESLTEKLNLALSIIFVIEAAIKIYALRIDYFKDSWNIFDFIIVSISVFGFVLDNAT